MKIKMLAFLFSAVCSLIVSAAAGPSGTAWAIHGYADQSFFMRGGIYPYSKAEISIPCSWIKFPANNTNPAKGPIFTRAGGPSIVLKSTLEIPCDGLYQFRVVPGKQNSMAYRLVINGRYMDEPGMEQGIELKKGKASVTVYGRLQFGIKGNAWIGMGLQWKQPGASDFVSAPVSAAESDLKAAPFRAEKEYACSEGKTAYLSSRRFNLDVPEDGIYEISVHFRSSATAFMRLWLDDQMIQYVQGDRKAGKVNAAFYGDQDFTGNRQSVKVDFFGRSVSVRFLKKGHHYLDLYAHTGPWIWGDGMEKAMGRVRLGVTRLTGLNPQAETGFYFEDRDSMVFAKNESLKLRAVTASKTPLKYTMEVRDHDGKPFWKKEFSATNGKSYVSYPCDQEGAFEYVIKNVRGEIIAGPWTFAVVDPTPIALPKQTASYNPGKKYRKVLIDKVECSEEKGGPHQFRDNGTSKLVQFGGTTYRATGETGFHDTVYTQGKDKHWHLGKGKENARSVRGVACDWFAYTLKVNNPGKLHVITAMIPNDIRRLVAMQAQDWTSELTNGWLLDAGEAPAAGDYSPLSIFVWPNADHIDVMLFNSNGNHGSTLNRQSAAASIAIYEYPDGLEPLPVAANGWNPNHEFGWGGEQVNLGVNERTMPPIKGGFHRWYDFFLSWQRYGEVSAWRGDNFFSFPVYSYSMVSYQGIAQRLVPPGADVYSKGPNAENTDLFDRDVFALMLMQCSKYHVKLVADFMIQRIEKRECEVWANRYGFDSRGMLLSASADEKPFHSFSNAKLVNPAHPAIRKVLVEFCEELAKRYGKYPAFGGISSRFWRGWPASFEGWFHSKDMGCDDWTVAQFAKDTGIKIDPVNGNEQEFVKRKERLYGELGPQWIAWRTKQCLTLREEMLAALRKYAPQAKLYTNQIKQEPASGLDPAVFNSRRDLGWILTKETVNGPGVEWNFADPVCFDNFDVRPEGLRRPRTADFTGEHIHDLCRYPLGLCCNCSYRAHPYQLEKAALALAEGKLDFLTAGGQWCIPPADEGLREFVRIWRTIPDLKFQQAATEGGSQTPVSVRYARDGKDLILLFVNRTDSRRVIKVSFDKKVSAIINPVDGKQLSGSSKQLEVAVMPYMPALRRVVNGGKIAAVSMPLEKEELDKVKKAYQHFLSLEPKAKGIVLYPFGTGKVERERLEQPQTYDQLLKPMKEAYKAGHFHELRRLVQEFRTLHTQWYEILGWPDDFAKLHDVGRCALAGYVNRKLEVSIPDVKPEDVQKFPGYRLEKFVCFPKDKPLTVNIHGNPNGYNQLAIQGLIGGGYTPIRVEFEGKVIGKIESVDQTPRLLNRMLAQRLPRKHHGIKFTLVGEGEKGLALTRVGLNMHRPVPLTKWIGLGIMEKPGGTNDWSAMEKELPPETKLDYAASYNGLNGMKAEWKKIPEDQGRVLELANLYPYDMSRGNGVAYLATAIKSKASASTQLFYSMDYFGKMWVNGKLVLPKINGPTNSWKGVVVNLKPGWNTILVKTSCGSGGWYAAFAIANAHEFQFAYPNEIKK